jgi:hypothetical protein
VSINDIIGPVSIQSATVLLSVCGGITAVAIATIVRRSRKEIEYAHELAVLKAKNDEQYSRQKQANDRELELAKVAANKEIQMTKIDKHFLDLKPNKQIEGES